MNIAPIVLFVYNRPSHTRRTVEALRQNELASISDLFVFSDAASDTASTESVEEVRSYIRGIEGFKSVNLIERQQNYGLARSITEGVTRISQEYGRVIVLEDDQVTSPVFLRYINEALNKYQDNKRVWHISGWNYPIDTKNMAESFFFRSMNCWGWATWADRWQYFRKEPERLVHEWSEDCINRFNLDGAINFWDQVLRNHQGTMNTWAIFWYATIFEHGGLCLNPARTYVVNIGHDGSGVHCKATDDYTAPLSNRMIDNFPERLTEDAEAVARIRKFYIQRRPGFFARIRNDIRSFLNPVLSASQKKASTQ